MTKPLVFSNSTINDRQGNKIVTWELLALGQCPMMHAIWDPYTQQLVCQFDSVKENIVDYPQKHKKGNVTVTERKLEQYYILRLADPDAIKTILENFVINYTNQEWVIAPPAPQEMMLGEEEQEFENETTI